MQNHKEIADCILAIEQEADYSSIKSTNLFVMHGNKVTRMSPNYLYLVAKESERRELGMPEEYVQRLIQSQKEEAGVLVEKGVGEVVSLLSNSRIRFSMLLDTSGGVGMYRENLGTIQRYAERSGGDFAAYGGVDVKSMGALLLMAAPKRLRFAHPFSNILFHLPTTDPEAGVSKRDRRRNRKIIKGEIRDLLLDEASEEKRAEVKKKLDETLLAEKPKTPDRRVVFIGKTAEEWGILKTLDAKAMARHLVDRHQMPKEVLDQSLIRDFFAELFAHERKKIAGLFMAIFGKENDE